MANTTAKKCGVFLFKDKKTVVFDRRICYNMGKYGKAVKREDYYERNDKRNAQSVR